MKKVYFIIIAALLLMGLVACTSNLPWEVSETNIKITESGAIMDLEPGLTSATGATITVKNNGNTAIMFGSEYEIQTRVNNVWYHIDVTGQKWSAKKNVLDNGGSYIEEISWDGIYGKLPKGRYRLVKPYLRGSETLYMAADFSIN